MKKYFNYFLPLALLITACNNNQETKESKQNEILLFPKGEKITNGNFTGTAYLEILVAPDSLNPTSVGNVTFEAGARTKWHSHPGGQILLVTDGVGYYQEKGQVKKILRKGDVVKCAPNIAHWHGASTDTSFIQLAITSRVMGETLWLEPVTDEVYKK
ncbi:MAG: cupin domain-containing protein [Bacteroidota bacterium]